MSKEEYYSVYSGLWCGMYEKKLNLDNFIGGSGKRERKFN